MTTVPCHKCHGRKTLDAFSHIEGGRCYTCRGTGTVEAVATSQRPHKAPTSADALSFLRGLYRAGATRSAASRRDWIASISEPHESGSDRSTVTAARAALARIPATEQTRVREAFASLGVAL